MAVYLIRHGETEENAAKILMGHHHGTLSHTGIIQAKKLSDRLRTLPIDAIYSSDLNRAKHTTEIIAEHHSSTTIYTKLLREAHLGIFQGQPHAAIKAASTGDINFIPKGGESLSQVHDRLKNFYTSYLSRYQLGQTILISGHHGSIKALLGVMLDITLQQSEEFKLNNCCLNMLEKENDRWILKLFNDISHIQ